MSLWERIERAVEKGRQRLMRTVAALDAAGVPYAVAGGGEMTQFVPAKLPPRRMLFR